MVGIFFCIKENEKDKETLLIHSCSNIEATTYKDYLNYPYSHYDIWNKYYYNKYKVDFDYYPRGRIIYNKKDKCYYIYFDKCIKERNTILNKYKNTNYKVFNDYHYQCHICNKEYIS